MIFRSAHQTTGLLLPCRLTALLPAIIAQPEDRQVRAPIPLHSFFAELREICVTTRDGASG